MKTFILIIIVMLTLVQLSLGQSINVNNTFTEDTTLQIFNETPMFYSLKIKCNSTLYTDSSLIRIILKDMYDNEYMIYENYKLIENSYSDVDKFAEETFYLTETVGKEVIVQIIQGSIYIDGFTFDTTPCNNYLSLSKAHIDSITTNKIYEISDAIIENNMLWFAGESSYSKYPYALKKGIFGDKYNFEGLDYYIGGLFIKLSIMNLPINTEKSVGVVIDDFDWRKKHGATDPNSPYFDGDPDTTYCGNCPPPYEFRERNGWMTAVREQAHWMANCPNGCYAFAPIGALEAVINLYYNQHLDLNLSEQQAISCCADILHSGSCLPNLGGYTYKIAELIMSYGLSSEDCFHWQDSMVACTSDCDPRDYIIKTSDYVHSNISINTNAQRIQLKRDIIDYGPHSINSSGHSMCLMGFGKIREGQIIHCGNGYPPPNFPNPLIVSSGNPLIGQTYWILKNAGGPGFGDYGYLYLVDNSSLAPQGPFTNPLRFNTPIIETGRTDTIRWCDLDGDLFYNWGIGDKPSGCPGNEEDEDCDDSNPFLGPMDPVTYDCTVICDNLLYEPTPMIISSDDTWYDQKLINKDIMIEPGVTLNILNTVKMARDAKIIVKQGGKLIINGGNITSACDYLWKGIEVWGNKSQIQTETNQGVVEIINGGTIENAVAAIRTLNTGDTHPLDFTGGIIRADGANFINNYSGIYIAPYHNHFQNGVLTNNVSYIQNCTFETNSVLNDPTLNPTTFICLNEVEGVIIQGNTFTNTNPAPTELLEKGNGIYVFNASCTIKGICTSGTIPCSSYQPNTFQGLNYAIQVTNSNSLKTVSISNNTFSNNYRSILLRLTNNSVITSNTFDIPDILANNPQGSYGMYIESCNGYKIEGNVFATTSSGKYGVAFKTFTNLVTNTLYHNRFNNLDIGVLTANSFPPPLLLKAVGPSLPTVIINGLQIKCNRFEDITNKNIAITSGQIGSPQGNCISVTSPANNMFSITTDEHIFVNPGAGSFGYCYSADALSLTIPDVYTSGKVTLLPCTTLPAFDEAASCPSTLNIIINQSTTKSIIAGLNAQINTLGSVVDGGNTQNLLNNVNSNINSGELRNILLAPGPYLSDTVLIAVIKKTNPVPPAVSLEKYLFPTHL